MTEEGTQQNARHTLEFGLVEADAKEQFIGGLMRAVNLDGWIPVGGVSTATFPSSLGSIITRYSMVVMREVKLIKGASA